MNALQENHRGGMEETRKTQDVSMIISSLSQIQMALQGRPALAASEARARDDFKNTSVVGMLVTDIILVI